MSDLRNLFIEKLKGCRVDKYARAESSE